LAISSHPTSAAKRSANCDRSGVFPQPVKSLTENIDTTTSGGKLIFHIFGALAEFERDIIKERTTAGLEAARTRGKFGGRPKALSPEKIKLARKLYADTSTSVAEICKMLGISRHTLQRYVKNKPQ